MTFDRLAVIGGGAWGTALAQVASAGGRDTLLWALEDEVVTTVNRIHENALFLKGQKLTNPSAPQAISRTLPIAMPGWW